MAHGSLGFRSQALPKEKAGQGLEEYGIWAPPHASSFLALPDGSGIPGA